MSDFNRGYMIAVSNLLTMYGREEIARGVLDQLGVSRSTMERLGFDEPDRSNLRRLFKESDRLAALAKRKATIPATGEAVPAGMKAWHGGGAAPSDWDGGKVLFRDGKIEPYSHKDHICWCHKEPNPSDIIAYTTNATTPATGHAATEGEG